MHMTQLLYTSRGRIDKQDGESPKFMEGLDRKFISQIRNLVDNQLLTLHQYRLCICKSFAGGPSYGHYQSAV